MKTLKDYVNIHTESNGLKQGLWLTSFANDINAGNIELLSSSLPDTISIKVNGKIYHPKLMPMLIASFERCYAASTIDSIAHAMKLAEKGYTLPVQQKIKETN